MPGLLQDNGFPNGRVCDTNTLMCWSAEVSAAFATAEWAGILWLLRRNTRLDRPFAIALSPIAAQEALQWLLWEHISTSSTQCDQVNVIGSLFIRQITGLVPLTWVWFAQSQSVHRSRAQLFLGFTAAYVALRNVMVAHSFFAYSTLCTTIGPGHHQAWPPYLGRHVDLQPALDIIFFSLYWMLPVSALLILLRPRWLAITLCAVIIGTMLPCLRLYTPDELGSVWCWSCSLLLGVALVVPRLNDTLGQRE